SKVLLIRITATNSTASTASAPSEKSLRLDWVVIASVRLLQVDHDRARIQPERDRQQEIYDVARIDHAFGDRGEMLQKRQTGNRIDQFLRRPCAEEVQHQREARKQEQEAHDHGKDEC